ncbi:hypothetical protein M8818_006864 [Zalaria obscura]|uniref:Uncharacterized protein n=1 Tax=Zalaria obscura TaxID=2024903 RepID=A0ACC3S683_9PEZI
MHCRVLPAATGRILPQPEAAFTQSNAICASMYMYTIRFNHQLQRNSKAVSGLEIRTDALREQNQDITAAPHLTALCSKPYYESSKSKSELCSSEDGFVQPYQGLVRLTGGGQTKDLASTGKSAAANTAANLRLQA